ncbi:MAG TPA: glycosyltransferase [Nitrospiraceae bacterium]|nr:glycosyltransferase [Nitrospiraceae bacterium]
MALVSVILPVYNGARFIKESLDSVLVQTFHDYEVICVDDGSTDASLAILHEYRPNITVLRQTNAGQGAARNAGVRHASGRYVAFIDQDDRWYPWKLEQQVRTIEREPEAVLVHCNSDRMDSEGRVVQRGATLAEYQRAMNSPLGRLLNEGLILPSAMFVRRDAFERVGGFDPELRGYEDFDLCARLKQEGRFVFLDEPGMCYRVHPGGSSRAGHTVVRSRERFLKNMMKLYGADEAKRRILDMLLAECYSDWGMDAMRAKNFREAQTMLLRSLQCNPTKFRTYSRFFRSLLSGLFTSKGEPFHA